MCIVCGPGGARFLQSLAQRYGGLAAARPRFVAELAEPPTIPPLDPADRDGLAGAADVILLGGEIRTLRREDERVAALAIREGRIQALGAAEAVLARRGRLTRVIDLEGRLVTPGFVNAHWHPPLSLLVDWLNGDDPAAPAALRDAARVDAGEWLVAQSSKAPADWRELVSGISGRPALLIDGAGQVVACNPAAAPFIDAPHPHVSSLLPTFATRLSVSHEPLKRRLRRTFAALARGGFTCVRFCGLGGLTGETDIALVHEAVAAGGALRVRGALDLGLANGARAPGEGDDMFRIDEVAGWQDVNGATISNLRRRGWRVSWHMQQTNICEPLALDSLELRVSPVDAPRGQPLGLTVSDPPEPQAAAAFAGLEATGAQVTLSLDRVAGAASGQDVLTLAPGRYDLLTRIPARRCGVGAILGELEVGRYADLAFIDGDGKGLATWIEGREIAAEPASPFA